MSKKNEAYSVHVEFAPEISMDITTNGQGSGTIETHGFRDGNRKTRYNAAIDGLESMILALACQVPGVDFSVEPWKGAVQTALDAITNNIE